MRESVEAGARSIGVVTPPPLLDLLNRPALATLLRAQVGRLIAVIGTRDGVTWPEIEPDVDPADFQLLAILATIPATRRWFDDHGVPAHVADASLDDIRANLRDHGVAATGIDWFVLVVTANVFALGRLQFEPGTTVPGDGARAWNVHIPSSGPLDPAECDASFAAAPPFFASVLGDTTTRDFVCHSWLLDDQLAEYLPADSNIVAFQRRFDLVDSASTDAPIDGATEGDRAVAKFIFRAPLAELPTITPTSRLERAVLAHLAAGRHWRERAGVLRRV